MIAWDLCVCIKIKKNERDSNGSYRNPNVIACLVVSGNCEIS